jgi:hypothetical protein
VCMLLATVHTYDTLYHTHKGAKRKLQKENNTWDSNVVPHRSTNQARTCLTSLSRREAVLSCWYGRSRMVWTLASLQSLNWNSSGQFPCETTFSESLANYHQKRQSINTMTCNKLKQPRPLLPSRVCLLWFSSCLASHIFCPSDDAAQEQSAFKNLE